MQVFETLVSVGHEARRFTETVQRFIEARVSKTCMHANLVNDYLTWCTAATP